jgi:type I restriction enzyme S subunit
MTDIKTLMPGYEAYKDSGVEWIGEIPEHWEIVNLGALLKPISIKNKPHLSLLSITREKGVIERDMDNQEENHNYIPDDLSNYKCLQKGQFGMNKMKAWQGSYGVSEYTGIISPAYYVFSFNKEIDPNYFNIAIRSRLYISFFGCASDGVRIGQWDLSKTRMKTIPFLIPSSGEQTAIANFLDCKITKIDQTIAIKEKQILLLKERKQILIQNAITKGLDPDVPMRDSGVEWIGKIPYHWEVKRLRLIGTTQNGISAEADYFGSGHPFVSYSDVYNCRELPCLVKGLAKSSTRDRLQYSVKRGDVLFTRTSETAEEIGFPSVCMKTIENSTFAGFLIRFRPKPNHLEPGFSKYYFCSNMLRAYFVGEMNIVTRASLSQELLKALPVLLPPLKEQLAIYNHIQTQSTKIDKAITIQEQMIEKLKEYKATLINSAVTGKIKVPDTGKKKSKEAHGQPNQ